MLKPLNQLSVIMLNLQDTSEVMANKVSQYKRPSRNFTGKSSQCTVRAVGVFWLVTNDVQNQ